MQRRTSFLELMQPQPSQSEPCWSECRHYIKKHSWYFVRLKKKGNVKSEKKKKYTKKTKQNDFISWTLPKSEISLR